MQITTSKIQILSKDLMNDFKKEKSEDGQKKGN